MPNAAPAARDALRMSQAGLDLVKAFESCMAAIKSKPGFFKPYRDSAGVLTIGWGHTNHHLPRFDGNSVWSRDDCDLALAGDMGTFERWVTDHAKVDLAQHEFDALVSWSFNTGGPATATLWKKLNAGNKAAVPAELTKWNRAGGKVLAGLVRRRKAEGLMFAGKIDEALKLAKR
ncbi:MAG: lysozyme [Rhizobiales bacterium]|nr:lysozyme [Hyphomicrobiales bacterium]